MKPIISILLLLIITCPGCKKSNNQYSLLRNGDIIFQKRAEARYMAMNFMDGSIYNHCGILVKKENNIYVLAAENSVKLVPLTTWIQMGIQKKYTIYRLRPDSSVNIDLVVKMAMFYKGRVYDYKYDWDDNKIYNAELLQKAFLRGADLYLGEVRKIQELFITEEDSLCFKSFNGFIPVGKEVVTVQSILNSEKIYHVLGH